MSDFTFSCPHCQQHLEAADEMAGQVVDCPTCKAHVTIPQLADSGASCSRAGERPPLVPTAPPLLPQRAPPVIEKRYSRSAVPKRATRPLWLMGLMMLVFGILIAVVSLPLYMATASHFLKGSFFGGVLLVPIGLIVLITGLFRLGKAKPMPGLPIIGDAPPVTADAICAGSADVKKCPRCAEFIKLDAAICRFCGHESSEEEVERAKQQRAETERTRLLEESQRSAEKERTRLLLASQRAAEQTMRRVTLSGTWLIVVGGLYLAFSLLSALAQAMMPAAARDPKAPPPGIMLGISIFWICIGGVILYGAVCQRRLKNYKAAMVGAVSAMFPCSLLFPISVPVGIWCFVTLRNPAVKAAFANQANTSSEIFDEKWITRIIESPQATIKYYINRRDQPLGQFSALEIRQHLETGFFKRDDWYWDETTNQWSGLAKFNPS